MKVIYKIAKTYKTTSFIAKIDKMIRFWVVLDVPYITAVFFYFSKKKCFAKSEF